MHIIKDKVYTNEGKQKLDFVSYNSNGTLSLVMEDGTQHNFIGAELDKIIKFIKELKNE